MEIMIPRQHPADTCQTAAIALSPGEAAALEAAGRAAGYADFKSTLEALLTDALDVGFRTLRQQQDREALAEAA